MERVRAGWQPLPDPKAIANCRATGNRAMAVAPAAGRAALESRPSSGCGIRRSTRADRQPSRDGLSALRSRNDEVVEI